MIKKIDRPNWGENFDFWFDKNIEPINKALDEAVEVGFYGDPTNSLLVAGGMTRFKTDVTDPDCTHTALLLNAQPIKVESAADVLRELIYKGTPKTQHQGEIWERAKAALERESDE